MPLAILITGGTASDVTQAEQLIGEARCKNLLADRGYDSDRFRANLKQKGITSVIPGKSNRKQAIVYDKELYKKRNIVERFIGRIKEYRRIATRYDKTSVMYRGMILLACICIWISL